MNTLAIHTRVDESLAGTANFGPRFPNVTIGRAGVNIRKAECLHALRQAPWLDPNTPTEANLIETLPLLRAMEKMRLEDPQDGTTLHPHAFFRQRPSIGYIPPEIGTHPYVPAIERLEGSGPIAEEVAAVRWGSAKEKARPKQRDLRTDAQFWKEIQEGGLWAKWVDESWNYGRTLQTSAYVPPVMAVAPDTPTSPQVQLRSIRAFAMRFPRHRGNGWPVPLYPFHVWPAALDNPEIIKKALKALRAVLEEFDAAFWGVHVHFTDTSLITEDRRRAYAARVVAREVASIAASYNLFTKVSDVGLGGMVCLDHQAAFTSYHPGLTEKRIYGGGGGDGLPERQAGRVLGLNEPPGFRDVQTIRAHGWRLDETGGRMPREVPVHLREADHATMARLRRDFFRPYNVAGFEWLNEERERQVVVNQEPRPMTAFVTRAAGGLSNWAR